MLHMLDTDIASYAIKGRAEIEARLSALEPTDVCVSAMTCAELLYGLRGLPPSHKLRLAVRRFLRIVRVLAWDAEAASYYADTASRPPANR